MKKLTTFPAADAPRVVRLLFWADVTALFILGWFCLDALSGFNHEKGYWGTRYAQAIATRSFFATFSVLANTLVILGLSQAARRVWTFYAVAALSVPLLFLWIHMS